jgi:hypothetical protein
MAKPRANATFVPGLRLCEGFYWEAVRPILDDHFPSLLHASALIGSGSEVFGFDDKMSADHHWGPRVLLFLGEEDHRRQAQAIQNVLAHHLPYQFRGYPTNFTQPDPDDNGTQLLQAIDAGPVNHRVSSYTMRGFFLEYLGFDIQHTLEPADWLTFSEQKLRTIAAGAIYHDEVGLQSVCSRFAYYPRDTWLYLLAAGWARIGQEDHLMGRAGMAGDEVGSALIGSRLVRDIMRLCFLMEQTYAPYAKWFGTAFKQLPCAEDLWPILQRALRAEMWKTRERYLVEAYEYVAVMHNALQLTDPIPEQAVSFHGRPFQVVGLHGFADALLERIRDPIVKRIAQRSPIGSIDQFSDSTDLVSDPFWRPVLKQLYQ